MGNEPSPSESLYTEELYAIEGKMLIVISKSWDEITDEENVLLRKILGALKLPLAGVQIITKKEFSNADFDLFSPRCILAFGATLKGSSRKYELITTDTSSVIVADELGELNDLTKRTLWLALKQVFQS
jgi:hypothetical protein